MLYLGNALLDFNQAGNLKMFIFIFYSAFEKCSPHFSMEMCHYQPLLGHIDEWHLNSHTLKL